MCKRKCWGTEKVLQARNVRSLLEDLKACSNTRNLQRGKEVHLEALRTGHSSSIYVETALVNMYAKCSNMIEARQVFDEMKHPNVVSWTALILGYADNGEGFTALDMFQKMRTQSCLPDSCTYVAALKACTSLSLNYERSRRLQCKDQGKCIHDLATENGCTSDLFVQNTLIDMYAKLRSMADARQVFDYMKNRSVVSWTALILGYADNGDGVTGLHMFTRMRFQVCSPNSRTFVSALKACTSALNETNVKAECRNQGKGIHNLACESDCDSDIFVQNALIDMYANCGSMIDAQLVFDSMKNRDVVSWTALILGYADNGEGVTALDMFSRMRCQGYSPDSRTFLAALKACTSLALKQEATVTKCRNIGKEIHDLASKNDCNLDIYVQCALIDMYAKCGSMSEAREVFDSVKHRNVVSWTVLILGYTVNGEGVTALDMFRKMKSEGFSPGSRTFLAALKACSYLALNQNSSGKTDCRDLGKGIHDFAFENGFCSDIFVQNALIDMYAKCGSMVDARQVFDSMKHRDVISWNTLILGYVDNGEGVTALNLFTRMRFQGCSPVSRTFLAALRASGLLGALEFGRTIHAEISTKIEVDVILVTSLVDFYAKCGSLSEAQQVFDLHSRTRDLTTWNALLAAHTRLGNSSAVFGLLRGMQDAGFQPDGITFTCILTCCSHAGLVEKGKEYFEAMSTRYGITPSAEHYTCIIDMLGRSNKLEDAMALLQSMPWKPDAVAWMAIMGACHKWKNVDIGRLAFQSLMSYNDKNAAAYVLMAHMT